ncbi:PmeII family type II restriction endonuclease [Flavivirga aquimarina]|uniref:PmeII family type II restriction endonuclease n=1 Tax=Flavivirga aquimarina TaxID=2027862 RepID=A0ABT8WGT8_9FLAO|nr:PmeII family type II restriction endonuclease [Flavivirga aquimarina]MDO5972207.1 PmeII family type II restriction endonuclease [Flavivirga aquimarina]
MDDLQRIKILNNAKDFFRNEIVNSHLEGATKRASSLKSYKINPFLLAYLANFLEGTSTPESFAKALIYPRLLSTSITTTFGNKAQKMISELFEGMMGSVVQGIDIEFIDAHDGRKKYCQLKSGPNTINKDDVKTIIDHFQAVQNLARTNNLDLRVDDMMVGVLYGEKSELSSHYKKIDNHFPVVIGKEFWSRLTGKENFYFEISNVIGEVALEIDGTQKLQEIIALLSKEIEEVFPPNTFSS